MYVPSKSFAQDLYQPRTSLKNRNHSKHFNKILYLTQGLVLFIALTGLRLDFFLLLHVESVLVSHHELLNFFPHLLIHSFVCGVCVCTGVPEYVYLQRSKHSLWESFLSFYHEGFGNQTHAIRLSGKCLCSDLSCWLLA